MTWQKWIPHYTPNNEISLWLQSLCSFLHLDSATLNSGQNEGIQVDLPRQNLERSKQPKIWDLICRLQVRHRKSRQKPKRNRKIWGAEFQKESSHGRAPSMSAAMFKWTKWSPVALVVTSASCLSSQHPSLALTIPSSSSTAQPFCSKVRQSARWLQRTEGRPLGPDPRLSQRCRQTPDVSVVRLRLMTDDSQLTVNVVLSLRSSLFSLKKKVPQRMPTKGADWPMQYETVKSQAPVKDCQHHKKSDLRYLSETDRVPGSWTCCPSWKRRNPCLSQRRSSRS